VNEKYGEGTVKLTLKGAYRNMAEILKDCMFLIDDVKTAMKKIGLEPSVDPIRGGTDGAVLSFQGLPCPNIGTGGAGYHGACEHISVEGMQNAQAMLVELIRIFGEK
jgi:tripeptide aminopeptidase